MLDNNPREVGLWELKAAEFRKGTVLALLPTHTCAVIPLCSSIPWRLLVPWCHSVGAYGSAHRTLGWQVP